MDYRNEPNDRDNYYRPRYNSPSYYDRRFRNLNGFSLVRNTYDNHYPNPSQNWSGQGLNQDGTWGTNPKRYNNQGNAW